MKFIFVKWTLAAALGSVAAVSAWSQLNTQTTTAETSVNVSQAELVSRYTPWAGSTANAQALVLGLGLGSGSVITLSSSGTSTPPSSFTPATTSLGRGEVNIALSLAKAELTKLGITQPTPAQLAAALNGGVVTTSTGLASLAGVLSMRSAGQGWGAIANSMGTTLGAVVSASKTDKAGHHDSPGDVHGKSGQAKDSHQDQRGRSDSANGGDSARSGGAGSGSGGGRSGGGNGGGGGGKK